MKTPRLPDYGAVMCPETDRGENPEDGVLGGTFCPGCGATLTDADGAPFETEAAAGHK